MNARAIRAGRRLFIRDLPHLRSLENGAERGKFKNGADLPCEVRKSLSRPTRPRATCKPQRRAKSSIQDRTELPPAAESDALGPLGEVAMREDALLFLSSIQASCLGDPDGAGIVAWYLEREVAEAGERRTSSPLIEAARTSVHLRRTIED